MKCTVCQSKINLQSNDEEPYKINGKPVCEECYFDQLGETIELHPIGIPIYYHH